MGCYNFITKEDLESLKTSAGAKESSVGTLPYKVRNHARALGLITHLLTIPHVSKDLRARLPQALEILMKITTRFPTLPVKPLPHESSNPSILQILQEAFKDHSSANWRVYGLLGTAALVGKDGPCGICETDRLVFGKKHPVSYPGAKGQAQRNHGGVQADLTIIRPHETLEIAFKYAQGERHTSLDADALKNLVCRLQENKEITFGFATNATFGTEFKEKIEAANSELAGGDPQASPRIHLIEKLGVTA